MVLSSRRRELWALYERVLRQFSVSPRIHAPILLHKLQKITKYFQCGYKTETKLKHRTHYAIFQNRRICADRPAIWIGILCGLCILPIYKLLAFCVCWCGLSGCLCVLGLYGRWEIESVSVFDGLLYIYKCRCKIYYTL